VYLMETGLTDKELVISYREQLLREESKFLPRKIREFEIDSKFKNIKKDNRLKFLISQLRLNKPDISSKVLAKEREHWDKIKNRKFWLDNKTTCYICTKRAKHRHHVIPLGKGGKTKRNNLVPLCKSCHCKVHPHMKKSAVPVPKVYQGPKTDKSKNFISPLSNRTDVVVVPPVKSVVQEKGGHIQ
jgi:5-methylcytosine-specific restriction enzyme A